MSFADLTTAGVLIAVIGGGLLVAVTRVRREAARDSSRVLPNPLADSPAVSATLAALGPQLAPGGTAGWLVLALGSERAAAEAVVASLRPGIPDEGPFVVNRLVGQAPVQLTGHMQEGVPVVTAVQRLADPGAS